MTTGPQFTCSASTRVQALTPEALRARDERERAAEQVHLRESSYYKSTNTDA
jgi:hypothetical protein